MHDHFTIDDLMTLLTQKAGLPLSARTQDETRTFEDVGLDSLAFLAMQTELQFRFKVEMPDDKPDHYTFGEIVDVVQRQLAGRQVIAAS